MEQRLQPLAQPRRLSTGWRKELARQDKQIHKAGWEAVREVFLSISRPRQDMQMHKAGWEAVREVLLPISRPGRSKRVHKVGWETVREVFLPISRPGLLRWRACSQHLPHQAVNVVQRAVQGEPSQTREPADI